MSDRDKELRPWSSESGMGLLSVIIGGGLLGLMALSFSRSFSNDLKKVDHVGQRQELAAVMRNLSEGMDCASTLGVVISNAPPTKLTCSAYKNLKPKRASGAELSFGDWQVQGDCVNDELIFRLAGGPKDKLTGKNWAADSAGNQKDIFKGASEFCRSFFSDDVPFTWKLAGMYTQNKFWVGTASECRYPNSVTGRCNCPQGYRPESMYDFINQGCANGYYQDDAGGPGDKSARGCGIVQYLCVREN